MRATAVALELPTTLTRSPEGHSARIDTAKATIAGGIEFPHPAGLVLGVSGDSQPLRRAYARRALHRRAPARVAATCVSASGTRADCPVRRGTYRSTAPGTTIPIRVAGVAGPSFKPARGHPTSRLPTSAVTLERSSETRCAERPSIANRLGCQLGGQTKLAVKILNKQCLATEYWRSGRDLNPRPPA